MRFFFFFIIIVFGYTFTSLHFSAYSQIEFEQKNNTEIKEQTQDKKIIELYNKFNKIGKTLIKLGNFEKALAAFEIASIISPNSSDPYYEKGYILLKLNQADEALESYNQAIKYDPVNSTLYFHKSQTLIKLGRSDEALDSYNPAIKYDPVNSTLYFYRGNIHHSLGDIYNAIKDYHKAILINTNSTYFFRLAESLYKLDRYPEALSAYTNAIELDNKNIYRSNILVAKAAELYNINNYNISLTYVQKALQFNSSDGNAYFLKGQALYKLDRYEESRNAYDDAILYDYDNSTIFFLKGKAFFEEKKYKKAKNSYEEALKLNPSIQERKEIIAAIEIVNRYKK